LATLEKRIGAPLIARSTRAISLTDAGRRRLTICAWHAGHDPVRRRESRTTARLIATTRPSARTATRNSGA
jgi:hypothetical protein